jgi:hypothetical protein
LGAEVVFDKLMPNANFCELQLDLCLLKEDSNEGIPESDFMGLTEVTTLIDQMETSSYRELQTASTIQHVGVK